MNLTLEKSKGSGGGEIRRELKCFLYTYLSPTANLIIVYSKYILIKVKRKKMRHAYTVEYCSIIKKDKFEQFIGE